jgi:hypothetical protein
MSANIKAMPVIGHEGTVNTEVQGRRIAGENKKRGLLKRAKYLIGKVVTIDEEWIFKSKEWPYY